MTATTPTIIALNRFGLGARPQDPLPDDPRRWLLGQMDTFNPSPPIIADRESSKVAVEGFQAYRAEQRANRRNRSDSMNEAQMAETEAQQNRKREVRRAVRRNHVGNVAARGIAAIESDTPFMERMVHFWSNHFAVSIKKNQVRGLAGPYEFEAIRPNILGSFGDLLKASALHPAMLIYLDQAQSIGPGSMIGMRARKRRNREPGLNENLAREILELHTLGVRSGYSQEDVTEFARALTGWTLDGQRASRGEAFALPNGSAFVSRLHEPGKRTLIGKTYAASNGQQALSILDDLAVHPKTARFIATKLARHFAADDPPESMIARLEQAFLSSEGDLPAIYRALVDSPEAWADTSRKFRQPWEWSIAALRATDTDVLNERQFFSLLNELGQATWAPTSPAGYDDRMASWAGPDALIRRVEAAERIAGKYRATDVPVLARSLFGDTLNDTTATWLSRAESSTQALALLLASPEMMRR